MWYMKISFNPKRDIIFLLSISRGLKSWADSTQDLYLFITPEPLVIESSNLGFRVLGRLGHSYTTQEGITQTQEGLA